MSDDVVNRGPTYRVPRSNGMDPATRRLAVIASGLGGLLFVVIGAWSTMGVHSGPVPVISPPAGPMRVKPENPGGMKLSSDMTIWSGATADAGNDKLAPAPETPDPQALTPPASVATAQAPAAPLALTAAAPVASAPIPPTIAAAVTQPAVTAAPAAPVAVQPTPTPALLPATLAPKAAPQPTAAADGHVQVQLAALPTKEQAEAEWRLLSHKAPQLLAARSPIISEATVNGRSWWRVRAGGFADDAQARSFCDQLRGTGGACSVARF